MKDNIRPSVEAALGRLEWSWFLRQAGTLARDLGWDLYAVGGVVRDLFLGLTPLDLDLVVVGNGPALAEQLVSRCDGTRLVKTTEFGTATILFSDGKRVDIATARRERYPYPGRLPEVEPTGDIQEDLGRRDFTINSMAVVLDPVSFGRLLDPFRGLEDLHRGLIRILHPRSFIDDPTRLFRAARYAARFGFQLEETTRRMAEGCVAGGFVAYLGADRLRRELQLMLEDENPDRAVQHLKSLGVDRAIFAAGRSPAWENMHRLKNVRERAAFLGMDIKGEVSVFLVSLGILSSGWPESQRQVLYRRLGLSPGEVKRSESLALEGPELLRMLGQKEIKRSRLYRLLEGLPPEGVLYLAVMAPSEVVLRRLSLFWSTLRFQELEIDGTDLLAAGCHPGPVLGEALKRAQWALLDGDAPDAAGQIRVALDYLSGRSRRKGD